MKHLAVFSSEIANILIPKRLNQNHFNNQHELNEQIKKRDLIIQQGNILKNWINGVKKVKEVLQ